MKRRVFTAGLALALVLTLLPTGAMAAQTENTEGIHDIFVRKDESKLERFKERIFNRLLYLDPEIDVSDIGISPNEILYTSPATGTTLTGEYAARYIVMENPFHSYASISTEYEKRPTFTYQENGNVKTVKYTYHSAWTLDFVKSAIASYDEAMERINPDDSDFAKILKLHDWIVKNVSYGGMNEFYSGFAIGALVNRSAVCAGYAQCYQFLLEQVGIESIYIAAQTKTEPHAWNLVKLDGHYFHVDCTWDRGLGPNPNVNHTYFMLNDEEFNADGAHTEDWKKAEKGYPQGNVCSIENKFYEKNTAIVTDEQIAANPIRLTHQYTTEVYERSETHHWRTCAAGVEVRQPHTGDPCTVCGQTPVTPIAPTLASLTITGADEVTVPGEAVYTAEGRDETGKSFEVDVSALTWRIEGAQDGVEIVGDAADGKGKLTVTSAAGAEKIVVKVACGGVSGEKTVALVRETTPPAPVAPTVTPPTANLLTYNGVEQTLTTAGATSGGTLYYSLDGNEWSQEIPKARDAGTYTVWYKVVGNADFADVEGQSVSAAIAKRAATVFPRSFTVTKGGAIPAFALEYTGVVTGDVLTPKAAPLFQCLESDATPVTAATAAGVYTITWTNAGDAGFDGADNYAVTTKATGTLTIQSPPPSGGSSAGGSGNGSGTITERKTNPDGSTTQTETKSDGTVVTTTYPDGSSVKTETKLDGSTTVERRSANGSTGTVKTDAHGKTEAAATIGKKDMEAAERGGAVTVPVEVSAESNSSAAPTVRIELPADAGNVKVEIPVRNVTSGTVAIIVHPDGTEEIDKNSKVTETGVQIALDGDTTVKLVDNAKDFRDTRGHWSREDVNFVTARELFRGVNDEDFGVGASMTRGMVNTVLARLAGEDTTPLAGQKWYQKGIDWARRTGVSDGTDPDGDVTREQLAAMLYRFAGSPAVSGTLPFTDANEVSGYARDALLWAVQEGVIGGYGDGRVGPKANAQRAQVAAMMARFIQGR